MKIEAWKALDGTLFLTEAECNAHNLKDPKKALVGLTEEQVEQMLDRTDVSRADALEAAARIVVKKRLASGNLRRQRKSAAPPPPPSNEDIEQEQAA